MAERSVGSNAQPLTVTIVVSYEEALRLSYMARFPGNDRAGDEEISRKVDAAIDRAEEAERSS
jgi:hypothetical protein